MQKPTSLPDTGLVERYPPMLDDSCYVDPLASGGFKTDNTLECMTGRTTLLTHSNSVSGERIFWLADFTENGTLGHVYSEESLTVFVPPSGGGYFDGHFPNGTAMALERLTLA